MIDEQSVPVTVLGGYLGSGKTTRINDLLSTWDGDPVAVVVNDFGAVNLDAALIRSRTADVLELQNGCVCCGPGDGMADAMRRLADIPGLGHVLIEVSGVGDPGAVAHWGRVPGFTLHGVVVCADAETVRQRTRDRWVADTVLAQLRAADVVLLTKTDLITPELADKVAGWVRGTAGGTVVDAAPDALARSVRGDLPTALAAAPRDAPAPRHDDDHRSWSATTPDPVDLDRVLAFLDGLPEGVVRGKGLLRTRQAPGRRTVVQLVGRRREVTDDGPWSGEPTSGLVLLASRAPGVPPDLDRRLRRALGGVGADDEGDACAG